MPIIKKICEKCGSTFRQNDPAQVLCDYCLEEIAREADIAQPSRTMPRNLAHDELQANLGVPESVTASPNGLHKICVTCKQPYTPLSNTQKQCSRCKAKKDKANEATLKFDEKKLSPVSKEFETACEISAQKTKDHDLIMSLANVLYAAGIATKEQINAAFQLINFDGRL